MKFSKPTKVLCSVFMSVLMSNVPAVASASAQGAMIPTAAVVGEMDRAQALADLQSLVKQADIEKALMQSGISAEEASERLASLSESELRDFSNQVKEARAGGDILITVLVVVLIIFLIKRM